MCYTIYLTESIECFEFYLSNLSSIYIFLVFYIIKSWLGFQLPGRNIPSGFQPSGRNFLLILDNELIAFGCCYVKPSFETVVHVTLNSEHIVELARMAQDVKENQRLGSISEVTEKL